MDLKLESRALSQPVEPEPGAQFRVLGALGEGGCGQVFEAWDARLCRSVALKRLHPGSTPQAEPLVREARLAASLRHPAFVQVYGIVGDGTAQTIVMELVRGTTLQQHCAGLPCDAAQALAWLGQASEAMAEAHGNGLVHGDLKPSNLMLDTQGRLRILDFGLARHTDPLATCTGVPADARGTIAYMAPERLMGQPPSVAADIYSLGVVLYQMLAGALPVKGLSGLALAAAQLQLPSAAWPFPPGADPALVQLVLRMTTHDPAARLPSMVAVHAAVVAWQTGTPLPAEAPGAAWRRWWLPRALRHGYAPAYARRPTARLALAGLTLLLVFGWMAQRLVLSLTLARVPAVAPAPYVEAAAMQTGMAALHAFDRDGSLDTAIGQFKLVLTHHPRHAAAAAGLSLAYGLRYAGDSRDPAWLRLADASAQSALLLDDQMALAYAALAAVREYQGRQDEAVAALARALALDPRNLYALIGQARLLTALHRYADAAQTLGQATLWYPRERRLADLQGWLLFQQGDYGAAERAFRRSLQLQPDAVYAYANLNACLLRLNRAEEALQVLQQGLQIRPDSRLYTNLGTTLFARGDYAGAVRAFEHAVSAAKGNPNYYLMWANLGDALRWLPGREADARQAYQQATRLLAPLARQEPAQATRLSRLGLYSAYLDQPDQALALSARALALAPVSPDVQFRAAVACELAGHRNDALAHLRRAVELGYPANLIESEPYLVALRRDFSSTSLTMKDSK